MPGLLLLWKIGPVRGNNISIIALVYFNLDSKHTLNTATESKVGDGGRFKHWRKIF